MISLLLSSIFSLITFFVFGDIASKQLKVKIDFLEKLLLGLVGINLLTTVLSLFTPLNTIISTFIFIICLFYCFLHKREILSLYGGIKSNGIEILLASPFLFIGLITALEAPQIYDSGFYHIQSIKWIEEYSIVPGLANLFDRIGFNPNIFTFFALTSFSNFFGQNVFSVNFTLFCLFTIIFIKRLYFIYIHKGINGSFIFQLLIFYFLLSLREISSPTPDFLAKSFPLYIFSTVVYYANCKTKLSKYSFLFILTIYAITVKLVAIPILVLFVFLFINKWDYFKSKFYVVTLVSVLILTPWLVRNVYLTGWLIFPLNIDLFNFDWQVPQQKVKFLNDAIKGWAISPNPDIYLHVAKEDFSQWFPHWFKNLGRNNKLLLFFSILSPAFVFVTAFFNNKIRNNKEFLFTVITSLFGVFFILNFAPDFRFGKSFMVVSAFLPLLLLKKHINFSFIGNFYKKTIFAIILSLIFYSFNTKGYNLIRMINQNKDFTVTQQKIDSKYQEYREVRIKNFAINTPIKDDRCFDYNLPCTPYPTKRLRMRGETIQEGFYIEN